MAAVDADDVRRIADEVIGVATLRKYEEEEADWIEFIGDTYFWGEPPRFDRIESGYSWVLDEFEKFTHPDPADAAALMEVLVRARECLTADDAKYMNSTDLEIDDWSGKAFEAFETNYIADFNIKRMSHIEYIESLEGVVEAHQALYFEGLKSAYDIGENCRSELDKYDPSAWGDALDTASVVLTVIGAIVAATTTLASGGLTLGLTVTLLSAATTVAKDASSVDGDDVDSFLADMKSRLGDVLDGMETEEKTITGSIGKNMDEIDRGYNQLVPPYPSLADIDPANPKDDEILPPGWKSND